MKIKSVIKETDWRPFPHYGFTHYKIEFWEDVGYEYSRHTFKREDGMLDVENWLAVRK